MKKIKTFILGIGAQKAGTSWLHQYINNDQRANLGQMKEYHYWNSVFVESENYKNKKQKKLLSKPVHTLNNDELLRRTMLINPQYYPVYFNSIINSGFSITGDITPQYSRSNEYGFKYIQKTLEAVGFNIKIIYLIRDPVERLWSNIRMEKKLSPSTKGGVSDNDEFKSLLENKQWRGIDSRYEVTIKRVKDVFKSKNIYIGIYEEMFTSSKLKELSDFIGIDYNPEMIEKRINASEKKEEIDLGTLIKAREFYKITYEFCYDNFPQTKHLWKQKAYG